MFGGWFLFFVVDLRLVSIDLAGVMAVFVGLVGMCKVFSMFMAVFVGWFSVDV